MSEEPEQREARFSWHPTYRGRTVAELRDDLRAEVARDQRAYALAMEAAEHDEHAVLAPVLELEKKWGRYDLDWATADPAALATTIAAFEQERERRQVLISFADYRDIVRPVEPRAGFGAGPGGEGGARRRPSLMLIGAAVVLIAVLVIVVVLR